MHITDPNAPPAKQPDHAVICPRCHKAVKNQEIGKARIEDRLSHVACAQAAIEELQLDECWS